MATTWSNAMLPPQRKRPVQRPDFLQDPDYAKHPYGIWREFDDIRTGRTDVDKPIDVVPTGKGKGAQRGTRPSKGG